MLLVTNVGIVAEPILHIMDLVVDLRWEKATWGSLIYWRTGNLKDSLLEIGIHGNTGELAAITLVLASPVINKELDDAFLTHLETPVYSGVPIFDITTWNLEKTYFDAPNDFILYVGDNYITVDLQTSSPSKYHISSGQVIFGVNHQDILHQINLVNLSRAQIEAIKSTFQRKS